LISLSFFLGASLPVCLMFLAVGKRYRKFFLEKESKAIRYMNYKFVSNKMRLMDVIQANLPNDRDTVDFVCFEQRVLNTTNIHHGLSTVAIMKNGFVLVGCLIVRTLDSNAVEIELAMTKKDTNSEDVLAGMLDVFFEKAKKNNIETIICDTDKREYHPYFAKQPVLERHLLDRGFSQQTESRYVSTR